MANDGLLMGVAEGLKSGIQAYGTERDRLLKYKLAEEDRKAKEAARKMEKAGLLAKFNESGQKATVDESGEIIGAEIDPLSPATIAKNEEREAGLLSKGLIRKAGGGLEKDPLARRKELAEIGKLEADAYKAKNESKKPAGTSEGIKALDKDFAKDYNDWISSGRSSFEKNMGALKSAVSKIKANMDKKGEAKGLLGISGRVSGGVPNFFRSEDSKTIQQDVQGAAQAALKAALGANFTEKEGERIMANAYDPTLSPKENLKKIERAIQELESNRSVKDAQADHFEQRGSLAGFKPPQSGGLLQQQTPKAQTKVVEGVTYKKVPGGWEEM